MAPVSASEHEDGAPYEEVPPIACVDRVPRRQRLPGWRRACARRLPAL